MSQPRVLLAAPVKNRAWVLPEYLRALEKLDYHSSKIDFCFIINDSLDETEQILEDFKLKMEKNGQKVILQKLDFFNDEWLRLSYVIPQLILMRNRLIDEALNGDYEYLFLVDSDIILYSKALKDLVKAQKDIVGGFVFNIDVPFKKAEKGYKGNIMLQNLRDGVISDCLDFPTNKLFPVDVIGGVRLINRRVLEAGVRFDNHLKGEDAAFCLEAKKKGFSSWCDSRVFCKHRVTEFSFESMETICFAVDLKNALKKQRDAFKTLVKLGEKFSEVIEEEQYQFIGQFDAKRLEVLSEIRSLEELIAKEQLREKINVFFAKPREAGKYSEVLPLLLGHINDLNREIGELGESLAEIDLQNRLLVQKKEMLRNME